MDINKLFKTFLLLFNNRIPTGGNILEYGNTHFVELKKISIDIIFISII